MFRELCTTVIGIFVASSVAFGEEQLRVGTHAPSSIVAEFITGDWAERGTACPVLANRDSTKVAVFVRRLDDSVLPLVGAIEELVAEDAALKWSFVFVSHENAPTPSPEEWEALVAQIRETSDEKMIRHLSIGVMLRNPDNGNPSKAKRRLGFLDDGDVVVMLIRPDARGKRGVIRYLSVLKSDEMNDQSVGRVRDELRDAVEAGSD